MILTPADPPAGQQRGKQQRRRHGKQEDEEEEENVKPKPGAKGKLNAEWCEGECFPASQEVTKEIEEDGLSESNTTSTNTTKHGTKQILSSVRNLLDVSSKVIVKLVYKIFPWNRRARRRVMGDGEEDELWCE